MNQVGRWWATATSAPAATGATADANGVKHTGENIFDTTGATLGYSDTMLVADFDDGTPQHDALGVLYGIHNTDPALVSSDQEAISAHGDSGGPWLIGGTQNSPGQIAGIVSFGESLPGPDIDQAFDQSFGEFSIATRISSFAGWINNVISVKPVEFLVNADDAAYLNNGANNTGNNNSASISAVDNQVGNQSHSSVAMDSTGDYVITWTSYGQDAVGNGYGAGTNGQNGVFARRYSAGFDPTQAFGPMQGGTVNGVQYSQVTNLNGQALNGGSVFLGDSSQASDVFQINQTTAGNQQNARVAMDAAGDFTVTWESSQDGTPGSYDIYMRRYARSSLVQYITLPDNDPVQGQVGGTDGILPLQVIGTNPLYTSDSAPFATEPLYTGPQFVNNGAIGGEVRVNSTHPAINAIPAWQWTTRATRWLPGAATETRAARQIPPASSTNASLRLPTRAGPTVGQIWSATTASVSDHRPTASRIRRFSTRRPAIRRHLRRAPLDPGRRRRRQQRAQSDNWQLTLNGTVLAGAIANVQYIDRASSPNDKYEVIITFDGDPTTAGYQPLGGGNYVLTLKASVQDIFGNSLDGDYNGSPGGNFGRAFIVAGSAIGGSSGTGNTTSPGNPTAPPPLIRCPPTSSSTPMPPV